MRDKPQHCTAINVFDIIKKTKTTMDTQAQGESSLLIFSENSKSLIAPTSGQTMLEQN